MSVEWLKEFWLQDQPKTKWLTWSWERGFGWVCREWRS